MTDEEARRIIHDTILSEVEGKTLAGLDDLVIKVAKAGYRAGLEEVKSQCMMVALALGSANTHAGSIASDALMDLADELDAKLKEQP